MVFLYWFGTKPESSLSYLNPFLPFVSLLPIKINILGILELQINETYLKWGPDSELWKSLSGHN